MSTQTNFPSAASTTSSFTGNTWTNINNIFAQDGIVATLNLNSAFSTACDSLIGTSFGFTVPSTATINGITVIVRRACSSASVVQDSAIFLQKAGADAGSNKSAGAIWPTTTLTDATFGSGSDLWGTTWTPAEINDSSFGLRISPIGTSNLGFTGSVDDYKIIVTYTPVAGANQGRMFAIF